jgi:pentatricopeptide repeat protein
VGSIREGLEIHAQLSEQESAKKNLVLGTCLVDMYARCGELARARDAFDALAARDTTLWNTLISGYVQNGCDGEAACELVEEMREQGFSPDVVTMVCVLKSCRKNDARAEAPRKMLGEIKRDGWARLNPVVGGALVDLHARNGELDLAKDALDEMQMRSTVVWNAMAGGFAQRGHGEEALACLMRMLRESLLPDGITGICMLKACGGGGMLSKGRQMHVLILAEAGRFVLGREEPLVGTALLDMYAKCGDCAKADAVFRRLPVRSLVSWNALLAGHAQSGHGSTVLELANTMAAESDDADEPNAVTLTALLNACCNSGLLDEAEFLFCSAVDTAVAGYDSGGGGEDDDDDLLLVLPSMEQLTCMVDLFGRAGCLQKAAEVIRMMMPSLDHLPVWTSLLDACRRQGGDPELGRLAFEHAMELDENCTTAIHLSMEM